MSRKLGAEFLGTFWLVFGGCGTAIFAGSKVGHLGIAFAFGLTVLTMAFAVGHISGGHFNPAVTLGLVAAGKHPASEAGPYVLAQVAGGILAAAALAVIVGSAGGKDLGQFAANAYGAPQGNSLTMGGAFLVEALLTFMFLMIILGATSARASASFAPIAIGLGLTLIHLISIPLTNTSVNPARSTSQALFAGGDYLAQLWLFWVAPIVGGIAAGLVNRKLQPA